MINQPDKILQLHTDFIENGADIILTSTFGASEIRLNHAGLAQQFNKVNQNAVKIAHSAVKSTETLIAGSMGPLGEMIYPLGTLKIEDAQNYYAAQAKVLTDSGVDLIIIETQFDLNEANAWNAAVS